MAWCPKCKSEYVDGITECVDCGCALVDSLDEMVQEEEHDLSLEELVDIEEASEADIEDQKVTEAAQTASFSGVYQNSAEKAEDNKSSAYTLLIVGGLGFLLVVLFFFDVLPIHMFNVNKYMICGVMGVLFLLFLIMGIVSMRNSKILMKKAKTENNLYEEIKKWCYENLTAEQIDQLKLEGIDEVEERDELQYFHRSAVLKRLINNQFLNLEEGFVERLVDEIYPELFGEAESSWAEAAGEENED